ncbi:MAG: exodeoxyribonuclease VII large subunit [Chloroflexi bacterium]|nr:exodeoxyribonuclease VII large subunit [Chloroflexota bacterium]MDA1271147.1 exodeoxyribonuclease VII large subunit [Chloroflexota bacterium]PKB58703.1 MAG: exodeoxyribonuclease VII large subunit [SAR202 cluster bacterium Casp-Chloro-G2]
MAVYTVSQVSSHIKESLESDPLLTDLWIVGEVSGLTASSAGHRYFSLKDRESLLRCVMFRNQHGVNLLEEGASVSVHGRITFYTPRGTTDFNVDIAMPEGAGELALELERLKQKLAAEGLFETSRKRQLPKFPKKVGVVTSPTGAVFHDIQNVMARRYPLAELVLSPTIVQGAEAAPKIAAALELLDREGGCDVIIVGRGGGSLEDLWPFNEEVVARAIYACKTPVVSAVGHETDETIADYVADVRAPTPSAAAELVVPDAYVLRRDLDVAASLLFRVLMDQTSRGRSDLLEVRRRMERGLPDTQDLRRRVDDRGQVLASASLRLLRENKVQVEGISHRLRALDPVATLGRGFSIVQLPATGLVVSSVKQVSNGDALEITVTDGAVRAVAGSGPDSASSAKAASPRESQPKPKAKPAQPNGMAPLL